MKEMYVTKGGNFTDQITVTFENRKKSNIRRMHVKKTLGASYGFPDILTNAKETYIRKMTDSQLATVNEILNTIRALEIKQKEAELELNKFASKSYADAIPVTAKQLEKMAYEPDEEDHGYGGSYGNV